MKKQIGFFLAILIMNMIITGCGGSKYSEAIKVNQEYVAAMEKYIEKIEKADNAKAVETAMNAFADDLEKIMPRMKKLAEKYPELKSQNPPEDVMPSQNKTKEVGARFGGTFMKISPYMEDPGVQQAQKRIMAVMTMK
jgi:hypothetical protein